MRHAILLGLVGINLFVTSSFAAILRYDFSGMVVVSMDSGFAKNIPAFSPVLGQFAYDTTSVGVLSSGSGTYRQHVPGGLWVQIGSTVFSATEYDVVISNNVLQPDNSVTDQFQVRFASDAVPAPASPITLNGVNQPGGLLDITFMGNSSLYNGVALPASLSPSSFPSFNPGVLSNVPVGTIDALFQVTALAPEPSSQLLSLMAVAMLGLYGGRKMHRNRVRSLAGVE